MISHGLERGFSWFEEWSAGQRRGKERKGVWDLLSPACLPGFSTGDFVGSQLFSSFFGFVNHVLCVLVTVLHQSASLSSLLSFHLLSQPKKISTRPLKE